MTSGRQQTDTAQTRGLPIEGHKFPRTRSARGSGDHHVGKAIAIVAIKLDREAKIVRILDHQFDRGQKTIKGVGDLHTAEAIGPFENPNELYQHLATDEALIRL